MKRWQLFVPLGIFLLLIPFLYIGLQKDPNHLPSALIGKPLPDIERPALLKDAMLGPDALVGEPFLLNVWATWCPTCINEHPYLVKLAKNGVRIVGLNYKDEDEKAKQWLERLGNPYEVNLVDQDGRMGLYLGVYGAPETFIVDQEGIIRFRHAGELNARVWEGQMAPIFGAL